MKDSIQNKYYVYCYFDPRNNNEPFYIGKGKDNRFKDISNRKYNLPLYNKLCKLFVLGYNIDEISIKIEESLTEEQALQQEIDIITLIGRKDIKTGPLLNRTAGGDKIDFETASRIQRERVKNGTHNLLDGKIASIVAKQRVKDGTHPFLGGSIQRASVKKRLEDGTHNFLKMRKPFKVECSDGRSWIFVGINEAHRQGFPRMVIRRTIKHGGIYTLRQRTSVRRKIPNGLTIVSFKKGDTIKVTYMQS